MDQPNHSENQLEGPLTFLFTNSQGNVIFADKKFIDVFWDKSANILGGEQLRNILIMDSKTENQLIEAIKQKSIVENMTVTYSTAAGDTVKSDSTILADIDENGNFMGMDIVLHHMSPPNHLSDNPTKIMTHSDVIKAFVEMEMNSRNPLQPRTYIQSYLVAQFNVLQIVLARIGGPATRLVFEKLANSTARSMELPIFMEKGNLNFSKKDIDIQGYRSLLQTTSNYAAIVVGRNIVKREMLLVDKFVGRGTLELISQMDLRIFSAE
jgi:hypothetical protein